MHRLVLIRSVSSDAKMAYNQMTLLVYSEVTLSDVRLIVQIEQSNKRVPEDSVVFGYVNELDAVTQITSIEGIAETFGIETDDLASALPGTLESLI